MSASNVLEYCHEELLMQISLVMKSAMIVFALR